MGRKGLLALMVVVLLLALGYFWAVREPAPSAPVSAQLLLPALQGQLARVRAIEVERAEQPAVRVERVDGTWLVPAKAGYPAAARSLRQTLTALAAARKVEARTANPAYHARLGLAESGAPGEQAVRLRLKLDGEPALIELRVGNAGSHSGQLVRLAGEDQVWLIDRDIPLPSSELAWLDRRIAQIPFVQIRELEVRYADGERLTVYRDQPDQPNLKVRQLPSDRSLAYEAAANGMANLFGNLSYLDAVPLSQLQFKGQPLLRFELQTFEQGRLAGALHQHGEQYWLVLEERSGLDAELLPAMPDWAFQVEPQTYQALARKLRDLLGES